MKTPLSKSFASLVMMSSLVGLSVSANAAPQNLLNNASLEVQTASLSPAEPTPLRSQSGPLNLLVRSAQAQVCDSTQSPKVCEVRLAAARRAAEVVATETPGEVRGVAPMGLLIPIGLVPVKAVVCDPSLTLKECEKLNRQIPSVPPDPLAPIMPPPPVVPLPPAVPEAPTPPVAADPESVIKPPPTGDGEIVKRPPPTGSHMPVIVPKAEPPVIQ